ncbi:Peptidase M24, structural domain protein [Niveomyces insectorum RCEF 264]|uniref:Peptidase M24, structural domain protein n=1 Tax=Niveomyces insectorum RCEF 264 TaxID=1081102 RepID=A0A167LX93_9HYPO|nr:Peptidase M24, structural domain protein [Niveomyces insectorum RCEF 264]
MQLLRALLCCASALGLAAASAPPPQYHTLPSLREQAAIQNAWTAERKTLIPGLLHKHGVDAWLMSQREYAEDTVFWSLKAAEQFSARRRTTVLYVAGNASGRVDLADLPSPPRVQVLVEPASARTATEYTWIENTPTLWPALRAVLAATVGGGVVDNNNQVVIDDTISSPRIAVNAAEDIAFAGGLHAGELAAVRRGLGSRWVAHLVNDVPLLAVELVATMVPSRLAWYRRLQATAWAAIAEAFSARVVVPGTTTTTDVEWWLRTRLQAQNMTTWFHPSVSVLQGGEPFPLADAEEEASSSSSYAPVIKYGDLLHVDFGLTALGLNTDTQHLAYVVPPEAVAAAGSSHDHNRLVPQGFRDGLARGNRLQDLTRHTMAQSLGRSGNAILRDIRAAMAHGNLPGKIYSHPIGDWGHSAGTLIGMTNLQDGVPVLGDLPLLPNMYYSIELSAEYFVPERNATFVFPLEEDVYWDADTRMWEWVHGQQEQFHLVLPAREDSGPQEL